jgi:hypothetical protein
VWKKSVVICFKFEGAKRLKISRKTMRISDLRDLPDVITTP